MAREKKKEQGKGAKKSRVSAVEAGQEEFEGEREAPEEQQPGEGNK